jgi:hypothetical protein
MIRSERTDYVRKIAMTPCQVLFASQGDFAHPTRSCGVPRAPRMPPELRSSAPLTRTTEVILDDLHQFPLVDGELSRK